MIPDKFREFVTEVGNTTREVCSALCSETYNETCSGFLYNRRVQSCQLSPYNGEWVTTDGLSFNSSSGLEFYRRLRCLSQNTIFVHFLVIISRTYSSLPGWSGRSRVSQPPQAWLVRFYEVLGTQTLIDVVMTWVRTYNVLLLHVLDLTLLDKIFEFSHSNRFLQRSMLFLLKCQNINLNFK